MPVVVATTSTLPVEGAGALELGEHEVGPPLHGVGALQPGVDPDRLLGAGAR